MPIRLGFTYQRLQFLKEELDKNIELMPQLGVEKVVLLNSLAVDCIEPDTGLKIVVVMEIDRPFVERSDFFYSHLCPDVLVEFIVYTPDEFQQLRKDDYYLNKEIENGEVIYAR